MPRDRERVHPRSRSRSRRRSISPRRRDSDSPKRAGRYDDSPRHDSHRRHAHDRRPNDDATGAGASSGSPKRRRSRSPGEKVKRRSRSRSQSPASKRRKRSRSDSRERDRNKERRRSRSRTRSRERSGKRRERDRSASSSSEDEQSSSRRRKEKRKDKERRKEKKREKKEKKKLATGSTPQWGKYGIISEADIFLKSPEFHAWLVEERKINPETISKEQSKKEFARYVEDFNTATLPHEKYYHMEAYERRMSALRQGEFVPPPDDSYDPQADMKAISGAHKKKVVEHESYLSKDQLQALRKVQHERIEAGKMKLLGMDVKQNMGVRMDGTMFDG